MKGAGSAVKWLEVTGVVGIVVVVVDIADGICDMAEAIRAVLGEPGVRGPAWGLVEASSITLRALGTVLAMPIAVLISV